MSIKEIQKPLQSHEKPQIRFFLSLFPYIPPYRGMLFCDPIYFLVLLPLTALIYWWVIAKGKFHLAVHVLLIGSAIFYCTWNWRFFFLLLLSALVNYRIGRILLTRAESREPRAESERERLEGLVMGRAVIQPRLAWVF